MLIAILHYSKPPVIGGVERVIGEQAAALRLLGHEVEILTCKEWHLGKWDAVIVHNVFIMPFDLPWTKQLIKLTRTRPDIRWINWVHDVRWSAQVPQAVHVAVSEFRRQDYAKVTPETIHVIPNGCDAKAILGLTERVRELKLEHAGLVLLQPTRFVRRKNIEFGLRLLAELPDALYLVTAAPDPHQKDGAKYFRELKQLAKELGVTKRVRFLGEKGALTDHDVRSLYHMADLLFFPSTQEGYGLPLIEAALHGVPVFCSHIPAHREVAVGATFFKLTASPKGLARKIKAHPAVQARQLQRQMMVRLAWSRIVQEMLEPLLSGRNAPRVASDEPILPQSRDRSRAGRTTPKRVRLPRRA